MTGFDIDRARVKELASGHDRSLDTDAADLRHPSLRFTDDAAELARRTFT